MRELKITKFETPYSSVKERASDWVRLKKVRYSSGYYRMEGVKGYDVFYLSKPIEVTVLQVRVNGQWRTLMVDDPLHWFGMEEIAELSSGGRVLIAGLGLGLILHHLVKRRDITEIIVYEIDREIISFIKPYIPKDSRIKIINQDYVSFCVQNSISKKETFNTAILDLWVIGEQDSSEHRQHVHSSMATLYTLTKTFSENVLIWGVKGYKL